MRALATVVFFFVAGCSPEEPSDCAAGTLGCPCYANATCNNGLQCTANRCTTAASGDTSAGDRSAGDPTAGDPAGDPTTGDSAGDPTTGDPAGDPTTGDPAGDPTTGDPPIGDPTAGDPQCIQPQDCTHLPPTDECQQRTCDNGACVQTFTAVNTPLTTQTPGDCKVVVCDGDGGTSTNTDDTDLPADGNDCTEDLCTGDAPSNPPVAPGTPCEVDGVCDDSGTCGVDANGSFSLSPTVEYQCAFNTVSLSYATFTFVDNGTTLTVSEFMNGGCTMVGASAASDGVIDLFCTYPGACSETYQLVGVFTDANNWEATLTASFTGTCKDCTLRSWVLTGTRQ